LKRLGFVVALLVLGALILSGVALASGLDTIHVKASTLTDHECNSEEWHFVINQVDSEGLSPASITGVWGDGSEVIPRSAFTGGVAHYVTANHLGSMLTDAYAQIYGSWDEGNGQFNLSHGPCPPPSTPTPVPTATVPPTQTVVPSPTVVPTATVVPPTATPKPGPGRIIVGKWRLDASGRQVPEPGVWFETGTVKVQTGADGRAELILTAQAIGYKVRLIRPANDPNYVRVWVITEKGKPGYWKEFAPWEQVEITLPVSSGSEARFECVNILPAPVPTPTPTPTPIPVPVVLPKTGEALPILPIFATLILGAAVLIGGGWKLIKAH